MIIKTMTIQEARKAIDKADEKKKKGCRVIVQAQDEEFNRKILENKKVDVLLSPELTGKDKLKERGSGLNEVLCKIAVQNKIKIGINIEDLKKVEGKERAILLSRIIQNLKLCKRTKTKIEFFGDYDKKDLFSLLLTLGASTSQAKAII